MKDTPDNWVKTLQADLSRMAGSWAEQVSEVVNGGNVGDLDAFVEKLKANTINDETDTDNAAEQIARITKWRVKLIKFGHLTNQLVMVIQAIEQALGHLALRIADSQFAEYIELDYLPQNPESLATPDRSGKTDVLTPDSDIEPESTDRFRRDRGGWSSGDSRPRFP